MITAKLARSLAEVALANVTREYPGKPDHVLASDDDIHPVELEHDEWLRELVEFKEKRIRPALELARRQFL